MARAKTNSTPVARTKAAKTETQQLTRAASTVTKGSPQKAVAARSWPGGKLRLLLDHVATDAGATAEELIAATGWQRHSIRGALSRLRSQGFPTRLEIVGDRKAYRLVSSEA